MKRLARVTALVVPALMAAPLVAAPLPDSDRDSIEDRPSIAALDAKNGFRGAKFGTPLSEFKNLTLLEDGYWRFFKRTDESMSFGGGQLLQVGYGFYKEELGAVILKATADNCDAVFEGLKASFGPPARPDPTLKNYVWDGQKVSLSFDAGQKEKGCYATFISVPEHEKAVADEEMAARALDSKDKESAPK